MHVKGLSVLSIILIVSSCDLHYWAIDDVNGELVSSDPKAEPISCFSEAARDFTCVDSETLAELKRKCKKRQRK